MTDQDAKARAQKLELKQKQLAGDWIDFAASPYFGTVIGFLKEQSAHGKNPFAEAGYDPIKAANIAGQQSMVDLIDDQLTKAKEALR